MVQPSSDIIQGGETRGQDFWTCTDQNQLIVTPGVGIRFHRICLPVLTQRILLEVPIEDNENLVTLFSKGSSFSCVKSKIK